VVFECLYWLFESADRVWSALLGCRELRAVVGWCNGDLVWGNLPSGWMCTIARFCVQPVFTCALEVHHKSILIANCD